MPIIGLAGAGAAIAVVDASFVEAANHSTSGRHVPQPRRAAQQHAASFGGNDLAIVGHCRKLKCDELLKNGSVQGAVFRSRYAKRL
jgi:hypothetical protein